MTERELIVAKLEKQELERAHNTICARSNDAEALLRKVPSVDMSFVRAYIGSLEDSIRAMVMLQKLK